jgi:hypothetical protein
MLRSVVHALQRSRMPCWQSATCTCHAGDPEAEVTTRFRSSRLINTI